MVARSVVSRNLGIDALRLFSVGLVVLSHYGLLFDFPLGGTHGVVIFFMISGYCMQYSTWGRNGAEFLSARFWRLVPTFVICATLTALIEVFNVMPERSQSFKSYLANVLCLPFGNLICDAASLAGTGKPIAYSWVDGAYWSLLVEVRFYLLLWLCIYLLKMKRVWILFSALGLVAATNFSVTFISKSQDFLLYLSFFSFGMAYRSYINGDRQAYLGLVLSVLVFFVNGLRGVVGISMTLNPENLLTYALCFFIFLVVLNVLKAGSSSIVKYFGVISYPLYLIHQDVGLIMIHVLEPYSGKMVAALSTMLVVLLLGSGVYAAANYCTKLLRR